ncbi:histamine H3 receptor [Eggerthellaceae bacterium zg-1084]|uniref:Histamine H3 receptor n=1 Tax=Berryella wangjianweii TaxID=2734634 RepID=A0A6M8IVV3_9ACTN|nr:histamine H3 receptor [Berryella wangjianweii]NPD31168.1 histamine H3 receptor [Berryella wangjianweii]NPD32523.1 histamine H3 receptor [Eggerthellaceae bacterium zg-997]QKF06725.1 histamine H3 receptor [Berryella wangjianweii]
MTTGRTSEGGAPAAPPKGKRRAARRWGVLAGVAALIAVAAIGFNAWHATPQFCNAICHTPMDPYVEGYVAGSNAVMAAHRDADVACLDCHVPTIKEQVNEATSWATGAYETDGQGMLVGQGISFDYRKCAKSGCHDFEKITASTADWGGQKGVNPHFNHQFYGGDDSGAQVAGSMGAYAMDCSYCHSSHGTSQMWCNGCHDFAVPEGWTNPGKMRSEGAKR